MQEIDSICTKGASLVKTKLTLQHSKVAAEDGLSKQIEDKSK